MLLDTNLQGTPNVFVVCICTLSLLSLWHPEQGSPRKAIRQDADNGLGLLNESLTSVGDLCKVVRLHVYRYTPQPSSLNLTRCLCQVVQFHKYDLGRACVRAAVRVIGLASVWRPRQILNCLDLECVPSGITPRGTREQKAPVS